MLDTAGVQAGARGEIGAIHDLDLEISDNEFLVLVGPSDCGKSTALRMVAGLEEIYKRPIPGFVRPPRFSSSKNTSATSPGSFRAASARE